MTKDLINTALLTLAVCLGMAACSGIFVSKARSEGLETAISDGGLLFKRETDGALKMLRCSGGGECMRIIPRGQKYTVSDVESVFKTQ